MPPERAEAALDTRPPNKQQPALTVTRGPDEMPAPRLALALGLKASALAELGAPAEDKSTSRHVDRARFVAEFRELWNSMPLFIRAIVAAENEGDPWLTDRDSAEYAKKVSASGQISGEWRNTLRALEACGLAHKTGKHQNSPRLVRRSTVDAVIRGEIALEGEKNEER